MTQLKLLVPPPTRSWVRDPNGVMVFRSEMWKGLRRKIKGDLQTHHRLCYQRPKFRFWTNDVHRITTMSSGVNTARFWTRVCVFFFFSFTKQRILRENEGKVCSRHSSGYVSAVHAFADEESPLDVVWHVIVRRDRLTPYRMVWGKDTGSVGACWIPIETTLYGAASMAGNSPFHQRRGYFRVSIVDIVFPLIPSYGLALGLGLSALGPSSLWPFHSNSKASSAKSSPLWISFYLNKRKKKVISRINLVSVYY